MSSSRFTTMIYIPPLSWHAVVLGDIQRPRISFWRICDHHCITDDVTKTETKTVFHPLLYHRGHFLWLHIHFPKESCCTPLKPTHLHSSVSILRIQCEEFYARSLFQVALERKMPLLQGAQVPIHPNLFLIHIFQYWKQLATLFCSYSSENKLCRKKSICAMLHYEAEVVVNFCFFVTCSHISSFCQFQGLLSREELASLLWNFIEKMT